MTQPAENAGRPTVRLVDRMRAFVTRHDTLFVIFGALIVFIAFFTKEAFLESVKDINAVLDQAISTHQLRDQFALLQRQLDQMADPHNPAKGASAWTDDEKLSSTAQDAIAAMTDGENLFNDASELLDHLPSSSSDLNKRRAQLKTQLAAVKDNYYELAQDQGELLDATTSEGLKDLYKDALQDLREATLQLDKAVLPFHDTALKFDDDVLVEARKQKDYQELRYHRANTAMYIVFAFGWMLGLLGKIWKLKPLGGVEEE
jgi:uncharacterized phage infection (PIP) family protein YhgE